MGHRHGDIVVRNELENIFRCFWPLAGECDVLVMVVWRGVNNFLRLEFTNSILVSGTAIIAYSNVDSGSVSSDKIRLGDTTNQ